jgi:hypothetical protein
MVPTDALTDSNASFSMVKVMDEGTYLKELRQETR